MVRSSTATAPPMLPEGAKIPAIKSEWEAVLQERLERKLRKPNRKRRARGAMAVAEVEAEAVGATSPPASPYPSTSSPPTDWLQQREQQEQQQGSGLAALSSRLAATAAAPPRSTPQQDDQQPQAQTSGEAEINTTASEVGTADVLVGAPGTGTATGTEEQNAKGLLEGDEGEGIASSERAGGGSKGTNARRRAVPPPLKRWPPGGPFGASKAVAWHAQQVVQSAVTPMQVKCVSVPCSEGV